MKLRRHLLIGIGLGGLAAATIAGPAAAGTTDPYAADVVITHPSGPADFGRFPSVIKTRDGRLIAVYRAAAEHVIDHGRIMLVQSSDRGRTWSAPRQIIDTSNDDRDPMIMQTRAGTLLLSFFQTNWWRDPPLRPKVMGTFVSRSVDGGRTWSEPVKVGTSMDGPSTIASGIYESGGAASHGQIRQLANGDLLIPLYGTEPTDPVNHSSVVRSTDGGRTWPKSSEATIVPSGLMQTLEPVLTVLPSGEIVTLLRTSGKAWISRSFDNGHSWTAPQITDMTAQSAQLLLLASGAVLATYGENSGAFGPLRPTVGRLITNPSGSWDGYPEKLLYDDLTSGDQANPSSAEIAPGRFVTLTFNGSTGQIVGVFSRTDDYRATPKPADQLDLNALHNAGELTVDTDMTSTNPGIADPYAGPLAAIDGNTNYWHASFADHAAPPASHYTIAFAAPQRIHAIGVVLKPHFAESAGVYVSTDGQNWTETQTLDHVVANDTYWFNPRLSTKVSYVRVELTSSDGPAALTELALRS